MGNSFIYAVKVQTMRISTGGGWDSYIWKDKNGTVYHDSHLALEAILLEIITLEAGIAPEVFILPEVATIQKAAITQELAIIQGEPSVQGLAITQEQASAREEPIAQEVAITREVAIAWVLVTKAATEVVMVVATGAATEEVATLLERPRLRDTHSDFKQRPEVQRRCEDFFLLADQGKRGMEIAVWDQPMLAKKYYWDCAWVKICAFDVL
ncbi:hypothetical protein F4677DRAFT_446467 [Hypoxylon crocopeplum]|nr:hypothetical protein F4677DRAFT_446467 [Hypoxylon crocopeplum]